MLGLASLGGCREREQPNPNPPDSLLIDSLSLTSEDHVHRVILTSSNTSESVQPSEVRIEPGHYVEFFTQDGRVRTVSFLLDSLTAEQSDFLRSSGQDRSPPLVEMETRYLVSFREAPTGRYPFVVEGNERAIRGAVVVAAPEPDR
jgi:plastocyanin